MTIEDDNAELVDLLYDDELDEETAARLRSKLEQDPDDRETLESYEATLELIRSETEQETAPDRAHDAIMEEARERAEGDGTPPRFASSPGDSRTNARPDTNGATGGLWDRLTSGARGGRVAIAATALLASGLVIYMLRADRAETPVDSSPSSSRQTADSPEKSVARQPDEEAPPKTERADRESETPNESDETEVAQKTTEDPSEKPIPEGRVKRQEASAGESAPESSDSEERSADLAPSSSDDLATGAGVDGDSDGTGAAGDDDETAEFAALETGESAESTQEAGGTSDDGSASAGAPPSGGGETESIGEAKPTESAESGASSTSSASAKSGKPVELDTSDSQAKKKERRGGSERVPSIDDLERAHDNGNWREVVRRARALRRTDSISPKHRPRMLELQAEALENLGRLQVALDTYEALLKSHPKYKPSEIQNAKERLRKQLDKSRNSGSSAGSSSQ